MGQLSVFQISLSLQRYVWLKYLDKKISGRDFHPCTKWMQWVGEYHPISLCIFAHYLAIHCPFDLKFSHNTLRTYEITTVYIASTIHQFLHISTKLLDPFKGIDPLLQAKIQKLRGYCLIWKEMSFNSMPEKIRAWNLFFVEL